MEKYENSKTLVYEKAPKHLNKTIHYQYQKKVHGYTTSLPVHKLFRVFCSLKGQDVYFFCTCVYDKDRLEAIELAWLKKYIYKH